MRIAIIAEELIASGLSGITVFIEQQGLVSRRQELSPDTVLIDRTNPPRDELESGKSLASKNVDAWLTAE